MGRFLDEVLGKQSAETLIDLVVAARVQRSLGMLFDAKLALRYVDIDSGISTRIKRQRALACDEAVRRFFGVSILDRDDPIPDTRSIRLAPIVIAHASSDRWLEPVPIESDSFEPDQSFYRWLSDIGGAFAENRTQHFLYCFRATRRNVVDAFWLHARRLSFWLCMMPQTEGEPSCLVSSPRNILDLPDASAPGFDALSAALSPDDQPCVKLLPSFNFFHAGAIGEVPNDVWCSPEGSTRLECVTRNFNLLPRMQGVHIWCCPSYQGQAISSWDLEDGSGPLPSIESLSGRMAIYEPLLLDIQKKIPADSDPAFENWTKNLATLNNFVWKQ